MPGQYNQPIRLRWVKGVCMFRCNLPPALSAEWPGSLYAIKVTRGQCPLTIAFVGNGEPKRIRTYGSVCAYRSGSSPLGQAAQNWSSLSFLRLIGPLKVELSSLKPLFFFCVDRHSPAGVFFFPWLEICRALNIKPRSFGNRKKTKGQSVNNCSSTLNRNRGVYLNTLWWNDERCGFERERSPSTQTELIECWNNMHSV